MPLYTISTVLLYALTSGSLGFPIIQEGLLICEHCVYLHYNIVCSSVETCLQTSELTHRQTTQDGKAITWGFLPSEIRPVDTSTGIFSPFLHCGFPRQKHGMDCATFPKLAMLNYIVGGLNSSFRPQGPRFTLMNLRSPTIGWSEDGILMERHAANVDILQIQIYPMRSDNQSGLNLKFITADGVEYKIPSLSMYSRPLAATLWPVAVPARFLRFSRTPQSPGSGGNYNESAQTISSTPKLMVALSTIHKARKRLDDPTQLNIIFKP